jgi:hypothetical protein
MRLQGDGINSTHQPLEPGVQQSRSERSARSGRASTHLPPVEAVPDARLKPYGDETLASAFSRPGYRRSMQTPECPPQATVRAPPMARPRTVQHSHCCRQERCHRSRGPNNDHDANHRREGGPNNDHDALHRRRQGRHLPHRRPPKARLPLHLSLQPSEFSCFPPNQSSASPGNRFIVVGSPPQAVSRLKRAGCYTVETGRARQ